MPARRPLRRHPEAEAELLAAVEWYEEQAGLGAELLEEVREVSARLAEAPESCAVDPAAPSVRRARLKRFPYWIVFTASPDAIWVLAVAHLRREPGYWRARRGST